MRFPPYPKYKPSGVEWLGEVPAHWAAKPLGRIARFVGGATPDKSNPDFWNGDIPWVSPKDMKRVRVADAEDRITSEAIANSPLRLLQPPVVLVVVRGMILAHSFPVAITVAPLTINQDMKALIAGRQIDPEFLMWLLTGAGGAFVSLADESAHGTRKLESETLSRVPVPVPPQAEQATIAAFLGSATAKLDTLIAKKRTLIERLKEKRTALISRTVTRGLPPDAARTAGLDPHPKLKPSGVEWLGEVPAHWEVKHFRNILQRLDQGWSPVASNWPAAEGEWGVLKLSAVRRGVFIPEENKALEGDIPQGDVVTPQTDDLLISRSNTPGRVGDAAHVLVDQPLLVIPDLLYRAKIEPCEATPQFVCYYLLSTNARAQIEADARGSSGSMVKLGQVHIKSLVVPCPPLSEQSAIVRYVQLEAASLDASISKVESAIERLQEYRTSLITAATTGRVDVRGYATWA